MILVGRKNKFSVVFFRTGLIEALPATAETSKLTLLQEVRCSSEMYYIHFKHGTCIV